MPSSRKTLSYLVIALAFIGAVGTACAFFFSLQPSDKSIAELPHISISSLGPGTFAFIRHPVESSSKYSGTSILFIRTNAGKLFAYYIPTTAEGVPTVPTSHYWAVGLNCNKFAPDFLSNTIYCQDSSPKNPSISSYRWSLEGKDLSGSADNLVPVKGVEEGGYFVLYKHTDG